MLVIWRTTGVSFSDSASRRPRRFTCNVWLIRRIAPQTGCKSALFFVLAFCGETKDGGLKSSRELAGENLKQGSKN